MQDNINRLDIMVRARCPAILIITDEEKRISDLIRAWRKSHNQARLEKNKAENGLPLKKRREEKDLLWWSITRGVRDQADMSQQLKGPDPIAALKYFETYGVGSDRGWGKPAIMVMCDLDPYLKKPQVERALKEAVDNLITVERTLILISNKFAIPDSCKKDISVIEWGLPTSLEITEILERFVASLAGQPIDVKLNGDKDVIIKALAGLTEQQVGQVLSMAVISKGQLDGEAVQFIIEAKAALVKQSGLLEFFQADSKLAEIGGLDKLRGYFRKRRAAFSAKAKAFGLPAPKGIIIVGVPGCGKSLSAKSLAGAWQLPLMRLDVGSLMGSLVGQSEQNLNRALQVAESAAPCILWLDELEKGFSGTKNGGRSDGGTTDRVLGKFLTWMQEKTAAVYIVATCNDISALPPELMRAGRIDDIFFVDLPNKTERKEIWEIHISKVGRDPENYDLDALVRESEGYTGSEIEVSVADGLYTAFDESAKLGTRHLVTAIRDRVPLVSTMKNEIEGLREWAKGRAKPASSSDSQAVQTNDYLALEM